jgi:WD40 repeat protein
MSIRHIQWPSLKSDKINSNQLAIQCDRCVRIYDMRRTDSYLCSIEHAQRIVDIDWTMQNRSIVTLSMDNSLRIFSTNGQLLAESTSNEQLPFALSKVKRRARRNKTNYILLIFRFEQLLMIVYLFVHLTIQSHRHLVLLVGVGMKINI